VLEQGVQVARLEQAAVGEAPAARRHPRQAQEMRTFPGSPTDDDTRDFLRALLVLGGLVLLVIVAVSAMLTTLLQ
jgi:hypothetical protein